MAGAFSLIRQQVRYARIEREQLHAAADGGCQQPCIGDLPVPEYSARANTQHIGEAEIAHHSSICCNSLLLPVSGQKTLG